MNTPFYRETTITMLNEQTRGDEFRDHPVRRFDVEANMAIDRGCGICTSATVSTVGTPAIPAGFWTGGAQRRRRLATVQAFGINNHREVGNRLEDPYVDDVKRGMRYLENAGAGEHHQPDGRQSRHEWQWRRSAVRVEPNLRNWTCR